MTLDFYAEWTRKYEPLVQGFNNSVSNLFANTSRAPTDTNILSQVYVTIRKFKNLVIGNRTKKEIFIKLGIIKALINILSVNPSEEGGKSGNGESVDLVDIQRECVIVLGSLAHGSVYALQNLVEQGVLQPLLDRSLRATDERLLEAGLRACEAMLRYQGTPKGLVFEEHRINLLVQLLDATQRSPSSTVSESIAMLISNCCDSSNQQLVFAKAGVTSRLAKLLVSPNPKAREASLDAIASLCRENESLSREIINFQVNLNDQKGNVSNLVPLLLQFAKDTARPLTRLLACTCLTNLYKANAIPQSDSSFLANLTQCVLPTLVKLLQEKGAVRVRAPFVIAYLVGDSENLQKAACECDAVGKLAAMLSAAVSVASANGGSSDDVSETGGPSASSPFGHISYQDQLRESALLALAAICSLKEECRKQVIDAKVLPHVVSALEHHEAPVRAAACQCARSLSRSVKNLRTSLVDSGVALPLIKLLSDDSMDVQTTAAATLCNLVLDFSPMKKTVMENGAVEVLVRLVQSMDNTLRLNSVWALKNLLYQADGEIKANVMKKMTYGTLEQLLADHELGVQDQALNLLRNLVCGKEADIEAVFREMGEVKLMQILEGKLRYEQTNILSQALFVLVNISIGNERHKQAILSRDSILALLQKHMGHDSANIRVATVWCLINLTWTDDPFSHLRITRLKSLGFEDKLRSMVDDPDVDVRDRVKTAITHFTAPVPTGNSGQVQGMSSSGMQLVE